ncbi:MAG TPA: twin-arginine translocation signal domain-containing protein [Longimicrobiales bacterium]|nr:twin-arginine translocation signal domain-containing protein [Longimicrobiales bacterium]
MTQDRRTFLKATTAALSVAAVGACAPEPSERTDPAAGVRRLDPSLLRNVGAHVLPSELGEGGREQAVQGFERWAAAYEPVPEMNHGYGTSEIRYGPPDPVPGWAAQLQALDLEATKRTGVGFAALDPEAADALLRRHIGDAGSAMPSPLQADHVAVALLSWWLSTPEATDRCYGVRISPETCRGIDIAPREPEALS